jgi:tRNA A37 threonylcarbamoyltransferase TsaD
MLIEAAERAMAHLKKDELLLGGGVACNSRLREMAEIMCQERKARLFCPPAGLLQDNGAMIAFQGVLQIKEAIQSNKLDEVDIKPYQRTDEVEIKYR